MTIRVVRGKFANEKGAVGDCAFFVAGKAG
jgi:hypothetical protein